MTWRILLLLLVAALFFALACGRRGFAPKEAELQALLEHRERGELGHDYWLPLAQTQDPLWTAAVDFCRRQEPIRPNCRTVLRLECALAVPGFSEE